MLVDSFDENNWFMSAGETFPSLLNLFNNQRFPLKFLLKLLYQNVTERVYLIYKLYLNNLCIKVKLGRFHQKCEYNSNCYCQGRQWGKILSLNLRLGEGTTNQTGSALFLLTDSKSNLDEKYSYEINLLGETASQNKMFWTRLWTLWGCHG